MTELMQRRRALMALSEGGKDMIPGKKITIQTEITNGDQVVTVFNNLADRPALGGVYVTTLPKSEWVDVQLVFVVMNSDGAVTGFRYRGGGIQTVVLGSTYDVRSAANTEYYLVEVQP